MQKKSKNVFSYEEIKEHLSLIPILTYRAWCSALYATGGRINEVIKLTKNDLRKEENFLLISLWTEKNKKHPTRILPIPLDKEKWLTDPIITLAEVIPSMRLFNFSDRWGREIVHRYFDCHPHFLRHCRLTHLVSLFQADAFRLQLWAGWSSPTPANAYVHLNWQDTKKIFEKNQ